MIELSNIIYENKKIIRFYLYSSSMYEKELNLSNRENKHPKSLYIRIMDDKNSYEQWIELPYKLLKKRQIENDYQIYINALVNEYGYSLNEHPKSYIDKILEKDEFIELTKLFSERYWQNINALL